MSWIDEVVARVNTRLDAFFTQKRALAERTTPEARELVDAVAELTMRGGKRLRPATLVAGFHALDGSGELARTDDACASLELMQSYLLIQDDWMDKDEERRGGASVHVALGKSRGDEHLGQSLAILAGDLGCSFGWELLRAAPFPSARLVDALDTYAEMHFEVVCGQQLDLLGHADVSLTHRLKTGSYTVRGPLRLGALLADATAEQLDTLERFGEPLGIAFQLRDDLLGTFGEHGAVGKPIGNDLRAGKETSLIAEARQCLSTAEAILLGRVLGKADAGQAEVEKLATALTTSGARARVEERLAELQNDARGVLAASTFSDRGRGMLSDLVDRLTIRSS